MERLVSEDDKIIFITGDLGFNALENLREKMGERFINAGVAEQNMIGVAAGMAYKGYKVFCYSIAPFIVYRCLEQFRNDVCLHNMPVFLVGNGGGYGYGIMGSSHHALEDIGTLSGMQNVCCHVPAFTEDVEAALKHIISDKKPAYLRLGADAAAPPLQRSWGDFNQCVFSEEPSLTIAAAGPVVKNVLDALQKNGLLQRTEVFTAVKFPAGHLPGQFRHSLAKSGKLLVVEEHVATGGLGQQLSALLLKENIRPAHFVHQHAAGYPGGTYGDQAYHQQLSGLDAGSLSKIISELA